MHVIRVCNVHEALPEMLYHLDSCGLQDSSRFGDVIVAPTPVTTVYLRPWERVIFWPVRDANPFFHLFEALWMLAGRNDVEWITYYNSQFGQFSDDGVTYHGAYGYRWKNHFPFDQLKEVIKLLSNKPRTRRAVIQMWDAGHDLYADESLKDIPCNLVISVWLDQNWPEDDPHLSMSVFCRSNDVIWGAAGSNAVHFTILQEYLAAKLGANLGPFYQISNNFHAYTELFEKNRSLVDVAASRPFTKLWSPYDEEYAPVQIVHDPDSFDSELEAFMSFDTDKNVVVRENWNNIFFPNVAIPMKRAYRVFKEERHRGTYRYQKIFKILGGASGCDSLAWDWLVVSADWMQRRYENAKERKEHML